MEQEHWLKWGVLGLAVVAGFVLIASVVSFDGDLEGTSWSVDELVIEGTLTAPIENSVITAQFLDGSVSGIASCNNYFGPYETDGDEIAFGPLGTTLMACNPELGPRETAYLARLSAANRFELDRNSLTLLDGDTVLVRYSKSGG